jgi:hypothetical protein
MPKLISVVYDKTDPSTDFCTLIRMGAHSDAIFLFNDNFEDRNRNIEGGNSARIRPYAFTSPPRALGIPTGWCVSSGGFAALTDDVKSAITFCFERLNTILHLNPHIRYVYYSCDPNDRALFGFAIFKPHSDVRSFLKTKLSGVMDRYNASMLISIRALNMGEDRLESGTEFRQAASSACLAFSSSARPS